MMTLAPQSIFNRRSIAYTGGYKYQLAEVAQFFCVDLAVSKEVSTKWLHLSSDGMLTIQPGYAWDGCSGPTFDSSNTMPASLFHDAGYQLIRLELLRSQYKDVIDAEFKRILLEDGVWPIRASYYYKAVDKFGKPSTLPSHKRAIHRAP